MILESPVSHIEELTLREFSKFNSAFYISLFNKCLFELVKIVKNQITNELKENKGAVMYDSWTWNDIRYLGIFLNYYRNQKVLERGEPKVQSIVECSLISVGPIAEFSDDSSEEDSSSSEANEFSAEVHVSHLRSIFQIFGIDLEE